MTKICSKCKQAKSFDGFHKNASCRDGLQGWCIVCQKTDNEYRKKDYGPCGVLGCSRVATIKHCLMCKAHYERKFLSAETVPLESPIKTKKYAGSSSINPSGYRIFRMPSHPNAFKNGIVSEHVFVMSRELARPLLPHESVHHKNGMRSDNRIENLELWSRSQPPGQRVHDKIEWMKSFLSTYGYEVHKKKDM